MKQEEEIVDAEKVDISHPKAALKQNSGRRYIPHGYSSEKPFKPHISHQNVTYSECGPDWKSRLRWLSPPKPSEGKPTENVFYPPMTSIRHFPGQHNVSYKNEYSFYPPCGSIVPRGKGKQTFFDNMHKASLTSKTELSDNMIFGSRKIPESFRNGISEASPGDKSYQAAEYSPGFHKVGSTRPVVNFGRKRVTTRLRPTVIFSEVVITKTKPFSTKEAERRRFEEVNVVKSLNDWRPATPLIVPVYEGKSSA